MPTYRCPVLIWKNSAGIYTASLVAQHERAAVGTSVKEVLEQLRSLLHWQYREESWRDPPDRYARSKTHELHVDSVLKAFLRRTGLPEQFLRDDLPMTRGSVLSHFASEIIEQTAACEAATDVVMQFKAGMHDPRRPLGVLLFCGPTGVGKTELAKSMSRFLFGASGGEISSSGVTSETATKPESPRMIRLDMSEYAGPWAADRLLMQSNGEPSDFLQQIRRQPFTVLLLDAIEKAHPSVYDVLMNVFDEGRKLKACYAGSWSTVTVVAINCDKTLSCEWDSYPALTSRRTREDLTVARQDSDSIFEPG